MRTPGSALEIAESVVSQYEPLKGQQRTVIQEGEAESWLGLPSRDRTLYSRSSAATRSSSALPTLLNSVISVGLVRTGFWPLTNSGRSARRFSRRITPDLSGISRSPASAIAPS